MNPNSNRNVPSSLLLHVVQSFLSAWALMKISRMEAGNILGIIFFLLCFFFYRRIHYRLQEQSFMEENASRYPAIVLAAVFCLLYIAIDYHFYIETLTSRLFQLAIISIVSVGLWILFYKLLLFLFSYTGDIPHLETLLLEQPLGQMPERDRQTEKLSLLQRIRSYFNKHTAFCCFLLCLLGWLPYYLYQYPGIMTPDSVNQFEQVLGLLPYSNHHPWIHTLLFQLFYTIGFSLTGSRLFGVSLYTFVQMCFLAFSASYLIGTLRGYRVKSSLCLFITLFYALVPYHGVFSVTIWKDIPFAAVVLLFCCSMLRLMQKTTPNTLVCLGLSGLGICLLRSNGWYAFLICIPFFLFYYRQKRTILFSVFLGILFSAAIIKYPVMNTFQVTQPDLAESLSIPFQQVAAVLCNDRYLEPAQRELLEQVADLTYVKELYVPTYADNIKELVRAGHLEYLASHKRDYLKLYLELGRAYPGDYLYAYINQTFGYWYPDSFYLVAEAEGISATSLGVSHTPLIRGPLVIKGKEIAIKLGGIVPLYGALWSMGVILWVLLFCIGNAFLRKERHKLILYLPSAALFLTIMLATPVATEFRYVYFMVFSLPFYLITALLPLPQPSRLQKEQKAREK